VSIAQKLMAQVETYRPQIIEAQRQLVSLPALSPVSGGQGEMKKALLVEGWLRDMGLAIERVDAPDGRVPARVRPNIVATMPGGEGPRIWALSHMDVVPPGSLDLWQSDPWTLRQEGDLLYGRGVNDNHSGLVCSFFGLKALLDLGIRPAGQVGLIMVSDEENGSAYGLDYVLEKRLDLFSPQDLIVVPDAGSQDSRLIEVAEKSIFWLKVEVLGRQVHASRPQTGVNALRAAARMMVAIDEVAKQFPFTDHLFRPPISTFEPTRKEAGVENINTVPGRDVFYIDCRVMPPYSLDEVENALRGRFEEIAAQSGATVSLSVVQKQQAAPSTPADAPVVDALKRAVKQAHQVEAYPGGIGGGTVAAFFRRRSLPAAVWITSSETAHQPNEHISLNTLIKDAQVFALLFAGV